MMQNLTDARVLVVGDVMLDEYWEGTTQRISPEAPVPIVHVQKQYAKAGGAANVALNIASLQAEVHLLGIVGMDAAAASLAEILDEYQIHHHLVQVKAVPTIKKLRMLSQNQQLLRTDFEMNFHSQEKGALIQAYKEILPKINVVIISDYGKGTLSCVEELIKLARSEDKIVLVDPKGQDFSIYAGASIVTPNLKEFEFVAGPVATIETMEQAAARLLKDFNWAGLLVTRGAEGMSLFQKQAKPLHIPTRAREVFDVTGAGDTVIAVLGMALSVGLDMETSINLANIAAGIVVGKMGTASLSLEELQVAIQSNGNQAILGGVINDESVLKHLVIAAKHRGETIVLTNGCFDILHAGHVDYLNAARALGDRLIVAVNTDESVARLKGPGRPINTVQNRMKVLSALAAVDWVVPFSEDTPERIITLLLPDILVKGADYQVHQIAGAPAVLKHGGKVQTISLTPGCSTSNVIKKILTV